MELELVFTLLDKFIVDNGSMGRSMDQAQLLNQMDKNLQVIGTKVKEKEMAVYISIQCQLKDIGISKQL